MHWVLSEYHTLPLIYTAWNYSFSPLDYTGCISFCLDGTGRSGSLCITLDVYPFLWIHFPKSNWLLLHVLDDTGYSPSAPGLHWILATLDFFEGVTLATSRKAVGALVHSRDHTGFQPLSLDCTGFFPLDYTGFPLFLDALALPLSYTG